MELKQFIQAAQKYGMEVYYPKKIWECYEILYQGSAIIGYRFKGGARSHNELFDYAILYPGNLMDGKQYHNGKVLYDIEEVETYLKSYIKRTKKLKYQESLNSIEKDF